MAVSGVTAAELDAKIAQALADLETVQDLLREELKKNIEPDRANGLMDLKRGYLEEIERLQKLRATIPQATFKKIGQIR